MADVTELVDALDLVVARAEGVVSRAQIYPVSTLAARFRSRRTLLDDTLIVAIAGGTGAGKSSVLNALAERSIASVSPLRPHTDHPLAWVPESPNAALSALLDELDVVERHRQGHLGGVAVIDLPDLDSVAEWHRRTVEQLLPGVDLIVWVVDPVKYHDRGLHEEFLAPLAPYRRQFIFVLNQIDRLQVEDVPLVERHLRSILIDDGHENPAIFSIAANPDRGPPQGVVPLRTRLLAETEAKVAVMGKLVSDVMAGARDLGIAAGTWQGWSLGFEERWEKARSRAIEALFGGSRALTDTAVEAVAELISTLGFEAGPITAARIAEETVGWQGVMTEAARLEEEAGAREVLEEHIAARLRSALTDRALLGASIAYLGVLASAAQATLDRRRLSG